MRRRRSRPLKHLTTALLVLLAGVTGSGPLGAQKGSPVEGALDFLLPVGARSIAMGQAVAAGATGSDAVWWNPALIARGPREVALHMAKNSSLVLDTDAGGAVVVPVRGLGAFALSVRYLNYGQQAASADPNGQTGSFVPTSTIFAVTFAPIITDRLAGGITYKLLRIAVNTTGQVDRPNNVPQTPALDLGLHYILTSDSTITIGASVRNLGPKLQVNDTPQADALPARADVGVGYAPIIAQLPKEARLRFAADLVSYVRGGTSPGARFGAELAWMARYEVRAGYVASGPTGSGATFGFGVSVGKLQIDLAQMLSDLAQAGQTPTFLTLRYLF